MRIALTDNPESSNTLWLDPSDDYSCHIQLRINERSETFAAELLPVLDALSPAIVTAKPSTLELCQTSDRCCPFPAEACVVSGSKLSPELRESLMQNLNRPLVEAYGLTEFGIVASECPARNGLHVDGDVIPEIINEEGEALPPNTVGNLVLTSLRNKVMPLVRYKTGDLAILDHGACACGRKTPRLKKLVGRVLPLFQLPSGSRVSATRFHSFFDTFDISEFQLTQKARGQFRIIVEPRAGALIKTTEVAEWICKRIGEPVSVEVVYSPLYASHGTKFERYRVEC